MVATLRPRRLLVAIVVVAGTAGVLRVLDQVPAAYAEWRGQVPHPFTTPTQLENALAVRLGLPFYFPDALEWPPSVLLARRQPLQVYAEIHARPGHGGNDGAWLIIRQWRGDHAHFHGVPTLIIEQSGTLPTRHGVATWVLGQDGSGVRWYRSRSDVDGLTTELHARLPWEEFRRMVESLGP